MKNSDALIAVAQNITKKRDAAILSAMSAAIVKENADNFCKINYKISSRKPNNAQNSRGHY